MDGKKSCYQLIKILGIIFTAGFLFSYLKKQQQQYLAQQNLQQEGMHMTFVKLHVHIKHDACTVQFQAWHINCSISAQIGLVITNHIKEFYYSSDNNKKVLDTIIVELAECNPIIIQNRSNPSSQKNLDLQLYDRMTNHIRCYFFHMRGQLNHGHTNTTALSSSLVVSTLSSKLDNLGSSPGVVPLRRVGKKNASSAFRLG